jgi:hypothetical protein
MPKRSRNSDNSKRPQPIQQQRAQARKPSTGAGPSKGDDSAQPPTRQGSGDTSQRQR